MCTAQPCACSLFTQCEPVVAVNLQHTECLFLPCCTKLDFYCFDGFGDPFSWIGRCEHFFRHQQTVEEKEVLLASFPLDGEAKLWFLKLEREIFFFFPGHN